jgi:hypothetical protein
MAKSNLFGKSPDQMIALMLIAQAEGIHPAMAAQEYDIIQGRPALKSQSALARFQAAGGRIIWTRRDNQACEAEFSHPQGGTVAVSWTIERAKQMGLADKDNWRKQPGIMLQWRCVAEGVRACYPACLNRLYLVEEVMDFEPAPAAPAMRNVTELAPEVDMARVEAIYQQYKDYIASGLLPEKWVGAAQYAIDSGETDIVKLEARLNRLKAIHDKAQAYLNEELARA